MEEDKNKLSKIRVANRFFINKSTAFKLLQIGFGLLVGGYSLISLRMSDAKYQSIKKCTMSSEQQFNLGIWNASYAIRRGEEEEWIEAKDAWARAIQHMKKVRRCSSHYELADRKIDEYRALRSEVSARLDR